MTQVEFIQILFDDLGYTNSQRRGWLQLRFKKSYADELTTLERSRAIDELKAHKEATKYGSV